MRDFLAGVTQLVPLSERRKCISQDGIQSVLSVFESSVEAMFATPIAIQEPKKQELLIFHLVVLVSVATVFNKQNLCIYFPLCREERDTYLEAIRNRVAVYSGILIEMLNDIFPTVREKHFREMLYRSQYRFACRIIPYVGTPIQPITGVTPECN